MAAVQQEQPLSFIKRGRQVMRSVEGGLLEIGRMKTERMLVDSEGRVDHLGSGVWQAECGSSLSYCEF